MLTNVSPLGLAALGSCLYVLTKLFSKRKNPAPLPPGPKGLPILGNVFDLPTHHEWETYTKWGQKWGDIVSINAMNQRIVIINSYDVARAMINQKGAIYADRPVLTMGGELVGWKDILPFVRDPERLKQHRKHFHQLFGTSANLRQFLPMEEQESHRFLKQVLTDPQNLRDHIKYATTTVILKIAYGYPVKGNSDPFIQLSTRAIDNFILCTIPGAWMVDIFPLLAKLPNWVPGTRFKAIAKDWATNLNEFVNSPFNYVKKQMANGTASHSFTSTLLSEGEADPQTEHTIKWSAASIYGGGSDTTVSSRYSFFLAMLLYPDVMRKAQEEIDRVVGSDRLPSFSDRNNLPYTNALVKEVLRWNVVTPISFPHRSSEDDIHDGYFIPKDSIIITNIDYMLKDARRYKNPEKFNPERFLGPSPELDPGEICFGFGRRICPGKELAAASLFMTCAMSLAVFDIKKKVVDGVTIEPVRAKTTGSVSHPVPFEVDIAPRSLKAMALISNDLEDS